MEEKTEPEEKTDAADESESKMVIFPFFLFN